MFSDILTFIKLKTVTVPKNIQRKTNSYKFKLKRIINLELINMQTSEQNEVATMLHLPFSARTFHNQLGSSRSRYTCIVAYSALHMVFTNLCLLLLGRITEPHANHGGGGFPPKQCMRGIDHALVCNVINERPLTMT